MRKLLMLVVLGLIVASLAASVHVMALVLRERGQRRNRQSGQRKGEGD